MKTKTQLCYLGLGSNTGRRFRQLNLAIKHIDRLHQTNFIESAPWYESAAWGIEDQPNFLNTVIKITTGLTPLKLLAELKKIEYRLMSRKPNLRWHSRNIDIDILMYGKQVINKPQLKVPHPFISERCFVVAPLMHFKPQLNTQLKQKLSQHHLNHSCIDSQELNQLRVNHIRKS